MGARSARARMGSFANASRQADFQMWIEKKGRTYERIYWTLVLKFSFL
jgi:hypothetical protein